MLGLPLVKLKEYATLGRTIGSPSCLLPTNEGIFYKSMQMAGINSNAFIYILERSSSANAAFKSKSGKNSRSTQRRRLMRP